MEKAQKIELPKPIEEQNIHRKLDFFSESNPIRKWVGYDMIDVFFYLYLFNKYKNNCLIKYKGVTSKVALGVELQIKQRMTNIDKKNYIEHLKEVAKQLADCIKRNPSSIVIPLYLKFPKGGHANILIYRKIGNVIEHFEPHGKRYSLNDDKINNLIDKKLDEFINILNRILVKDKKQPITIIKATTVCPMNQGLQYLEEISNIKKSKIEGSGYCAAWSMFFTELALKNPKISSDQLLYIIYDKLYSEISDNKDRSNYLRKVIIGYINLIYKKIEKYFSFIFGEKLTGERLSEILKHSINKKFFSDFDTLINIEMELLNNPSLTKEQYLILLQNRKINTQDPLEISNIDKQINMFSNMNLLLNPSSSSGKISSLKEIKDSQNSKSKKIISSPKSITKKMRKSKEYEEVVVDDIVYGRKTPDYPPPSEVYEHQTPDYPPPSEVYEHQTPVYLSPSEVYGPQTPDYPPPSEVYGPQTPDYPPPSEKLSPKKDIPIELESLSSISSLVITPNCPEGKVFDHKKGRCVKIRKTKKDSPKVMRKSPNSKTKKIKPCPEGEERNLKTGRCRKIKVYPPCKDGQIRDPITHRCRKQK